MSTTSNIASSSAPASSSSSSLLPPISLKTTRPYAPPSSYDTGKNTVKTGYMCRGHNGAHKPGPYNKPPPATLLDRISEREAYNHAISPSRKTTRTKPRTVKKPLPSSDAFDHRCRCTALLPCPSHPGNCPQNAIDIEQLEDTPRANLAKRIRPLPPRGLGPTISPDGVYCTTNIHSIDLILEWYKALREKALHQQGLEYYDEPTD